MWAKLVTSSTRAQLRVYITECLPCARKYVRGAEFAKKITLRVSNIKVLRLKVIFQLKNEQKSTNQSYNLQKLL